MNQEGIDLTRSQPSLVLIERMQRGDATARDVLIERYWPRLERWAHGRLPHEARDLNDTADLVQDTLLAALARLQEFTPEHDAALQVYFRVALRNRIRSLAERRRRADGPADVDSLLVDPRPSPLEEAIGAEAFACYERALERLSPEDRDVIVLRIELDLPYEEIARGLGRPNAIAVRKAVSRALVRLAREMQSDA